MPKSQHCCETVVPVNAARSFSRHGEILDRRVVVELLERFKGRRVLEVGAGGLRNALYLQGKGYRVTVLEAKGISDRFPDKYERFLSAGGRLVYSLPANAKFPIALATFVFETICRPEQRIALVSRIKECLLTNGALLISIRGPADLVTAHASGKPCSDGFVTPNRSFSRSFTRDQLARLLQSGGFSRVEFLHKPDTKAPEYLHAIAWKDATSKEER